MLNSVIYFHKCRKICVKIIFLNKNYQKLLDTLFEKKPITSILFQNQMWRRFLFSFLDEFSRHIMYYFSWSNFLKNVHLPIYLLHRVHLAIIAIGGHTVYVNILLSFIQNFSVVLRTFCRKNKHLKVSKRLRFRVWLSVHKVIWHFFLLY